MNDEQMHGRYELYDVQTRNIVAFASCRCEISRIARSFVKNEPEREFIVGYEGCRGYRIVKRYGGKAA
jgi:hypothetical protein